MLYEVITAGAHVAYETAARELGYPVVLKAEAPDILHKSDLGVVRLDIGNEAELRPAYAEIVAAARGHELHGVLVQPMIPGAEVIVGARVDPAVGPVLLVGSGGVLRITSYNVCYTKLLRTQRATSSRAPSRSSSLCRTALTLRSMSSAAQPRECAM